MKYYHGTTSKNTSKILKCGICTPKSCQGTPVWPKCSVDGIYVTPSLKIAQFYAERACDTPSSGIQRGGTPVVWEIDGAEFDKAGCKVEIDPEFEGWDSSGEEEAFVLLGCKCVQPMRKVSRRFRKE